MPRYNLATGRPIYSILTQRPARTCFEPPPPTTPPTGCCYAQLIGGVLMRPTFIRLTLSGFLRVCANDPELDGGDNSVDRWTTYDFNRTLDLTDHYWIDSPGLRRCGWQLVQTASHTTTQLRYVGPDCTGPLESPNGTRVRSTDRIIHKIEIAWAASFGWRLSAYESYVQGPVFAGDGGTVGAFFHGGVSANPAQQAALNPPIDPTSSILPTIPNTPAFFGSVPFVSHGTAIARFMNYVPCV